MTFSEWPYVEAQRIVDRCKRLGKTSIVVETGYGPSGLPHIGTFGEVARTSFVLQALATIAPEIDQHLIAFSDDMDGLREAPKNIPNQDMVKQHLGKPLTAVPDPYGEEKSFAHYMNKKLREFLDSFGFEYEFRSSTEQYRAGVFNEGLKRIMSNREAITKAFTATISKDKRDAWSPFFPICKECGKIYSTRVTDYNVENNSVTYICDQSADGKYSACGHEGETSILDGNVKVGWKVDWALRWFALNIDYEMHGEDLMESGRLSSKLVKMIDAEAPELFKYELFLDEKGQKISKKIGNGVSIDQWLSYGPVDSLLYFMYDRPQKSKKMGLPIFPKIVDEYLTLIGAYDGEEKDHAGHFVLRQSKKGHADMSEDGDKIVTYSLIYNLLIALGQADKELIRSYLLGYQPQIEKNIAYYDALIDDVIRYYTEVYLPNRVEEKPDPSLKPLVEKLLTVIENARETSTADEFQNMVYLVGKENEVKPKVWFKNLYQLFLSQSSGPKIGSFIMLLGKEKVSERIRAYLAE